jgi:hypothetical protein
LFVCVCVCVCVCCRIHEISAVMECAEEDTFPEIRDIFFLKSPALYFYSTECVMMLICLYLAFYFSNYLQEAEHTDHSRLWVFMSLLPCAVSVLLFLYVAKSAALTKAIIHLDLESVEKILEESESVHHLGELVRQKILRRLKTASASRPEDHVINFFKQLDIDNSNSLSRLEFKEALQIMRVCFSSLCYSLLLLLRNRITIFIFAIAVIALFCRSSSVGNVGEKYLE